MSIDKSEISAVLRRSPSLGRISSLPAMRHSQAGARGHGQLSIACPDSSEYYSCHKFLNWDDGAAYDFLYAQDIVLDPVSGAIAVSTLTVPTINAELVIAVTSFAYRILAESRYMRVLENNYGRYGPVSVAHFKAREYYRQSLSLLADSGPSDIIRLNRDGEYIALETGRPEQLPDLLEPDPDVQATPAKRAGGPSRQSAEPSGLARALLRTELHSGRLPLADLIHFPEVQALEDERGRVVDLQLDGGQYPDRRHPDEPPPPLQHHDSAAPGPGGLRIAFAQQADTDPALLRVIYYWMRPGAPPKALFIKVCSGYSYYEYHRRVIVKKKGSWFRKKTTITTLIEELSETGMRCERMQFPFE